MGDAAEKIIVALDRDGEQANLDLVEALAGKARWYKVGMRLFYSGASRVLDAIRAQDAKLFLDLKLHDIPKTVGTAVEALAPLRPSLLTIHASGGAEMVKAAADAAPETLRLLAVTVLTSLSDADLMRLGLLENSRGTARRWGQMAIESGAAGLVCSGHEARYLRGDFADAMLVTPGIRMPEGDHGDQKRVMTPDQAIANGASHLVVGRPIHSAQSPLAAFERFVSAVASGSPE